MFLPPISTERDALRACCVNCDGAVSHILRAKPRGKWTRSPFTSQPISFKIESASASSRKSMPISSKMVSALFSMISQASSERISTGSIWRVIYGAACSAPAPPRALRRASLPPPRRLRLSVVCSLIFLSFLT